MGQTTETLLYVVDIQANNARLAELAKQVREAKEAFATLQAQVKAGAAEASLLDSASVKLKTTLATTSQETRVLLSANLAQAKATQAATGSNEQLRAQLALNTTAYNKLSIADRESSEAGQALQAQTKAISDELKKNESAVGDNRRNVGNYTGALNELIPTLVKLQEQQKASTPDSAAYKEVTKQIGFVQQAAQEAGTKMGLSAEQTTAKLNTVAAAIRPATAELVRLEGEQAKVEKGSEAYTQIGFKVNKLTKEIGQAPVALEKVEAASNGVSSGLQGAISKGLVPFQGQIDRVTGLVGKFKSGTELLNTGLASLKGGGETGALGFRALAAGIAATGIGLLLIAFSALIGYFTQTNEGSKLLKQALAGVGAVVTTLANGAFEAGKYLTKLFTDPKQVAQDFISFLKDQVVNRVQAFGVLLDGIRNRDFKKIADSVLQFNLGITDGTTKLTKYAEGVRDVAINAKELEEQQQKLKKSRAELEIDEVKEKGRVEELLRLSKDRTQSAGERLNGLKEAGRLESELSAKSLAQTSQELALLQQRNKAKGLSATADEIQEERDKRKEYNATVAERNSTLATIKARQSRFVLEEAAERTKAAEDAIKERIAATEAELLTAKQGSERELELQKQLTLQKAELEKAAANKSAADRKLITSQSLAELLKEEDEYLKKRQELAAKQLETEDAQRLTAYNAQKKRDEDAQKDKEADYQHDLGVLERYLDRRRTALETDYAEGKTDKKAYDKAIGLLDDTSFGARIVLAKQYGKDTSKLEADQAKAHRTQLVGQREAEKKLNEDRLRDAESFGAEVGSLFAQSLQDTGESLQQFAGKVLVLILDSLEKAVIAAAAEATAKSIGADPTPLGFVQAALTTAAITVAFEGAKSAIAGSSAKPFATGGVVPGVGNTDSVPTILTPGEIVLNKAASEANAPLLSYLNSLYGGVNFAPGFNPARQISSPTDGGLVARSLVSGPAIDYKQLAAACANIPAPIVNPSHVMAAANQRAVRIGRTELK